MNYKIIQDEEKLKEFISWLPELNYNEKYYVTLFARKKYHGSIPSDKAQIKRFVAHKGNLFDKIKQLECEVGSYMINSKVVPQESLVLYIIPTPRDLKKATIKILKSVSDLILKDTNYNIQAEVLTTIQKSSSREVFKDFDIDVPDANIDAYKEVLDKGSYHVVKTRGGYHLLVEVQKQKDKHWYNNIFKVAKDNGFKIDQSGDQLLPVPGSYQGGFTPKIL